MSDAAFGKCEDCDGTGKLRYHSKSEMKRVTTLRGNHPPCVACGGTGKIEYVSEPIHDVEITYNDGRVEMKKIPQHCLGTCFVTGREDRMENVTVRFISKRSDGVYVYREGLQKLEGGGGDKNKKGSP